MLRSSSGTTSTLSATTVAVRGPSFASQKKPNSSTYSPPQQGTNHRNGLQPVLSRPHQPQKPSPQSCRRSQPRIDLPHLHLEARQKQRRPQNHQRNQLPRRPTSQQHALYHLRHRRRLVHRRPRHHQRVSTPTPRTWIRLSPEGVKSPPFLLENGTQFKLGSSLTFECQLSQSHRKTEKEKSDKCPFCRNNEKDCIFLPCKHNVACQRCVQEHELTHCVTCGSEIIENMKIYKV